MKITFVARQMTESEIMTVTVYFEHVAEGGCFSMYQHWNYYDRRLRGNVVSCPENAFPFDYRLRQTVEMMGLVDFALQRHGPKALEDGSPPVIGILSVMERLAREGEWVKIPGSDSGSVRNVIVAWDVPESALAAPTV